MAANLRLVAHAAQRNANEFAPRGFGDGFAQRCLTHTRRADKAHDRAFQLFRALLNGKVLDDAFLDLFKPVVIGIKHLFGVAQVFLDAGFFAPRDRQHPVKIVAHDGGFGAHRAHVLELFDLGVGLFLGFFGQLGLVDLGFQFSHFVLAFLAVAQFLLNSLHLLIQIILALRALHLGFDAGFDLFLDLQNGHFALHQAIDLFEPLAHCEGFQKFLLLINLDPEMPCDKVSKFGRLLGL